MPEPRLLGLHLLMGHYHSFRAVSSWVINSCFLRNLAIRLAKTKGRQVVSVILRQTSAFQLRDLPHYLKYEPLFASEKELPFVRRPKTFVLPVLGSCLNMRGSGD